MSHIFFLEMNHILLYNFKRAKYDTQGGPIMNSIIHAIYYHRYRPKTMDPAIASECAEMFDVGFCMGARIMLEVLTTINFP